MIEYEVDLMNESGEGPISERKKLVRLELHEKLLLQATMNLIYRITEVAKFATKKEKSDLTKASEVLFEIVRTTFERD